VRASPAIVITFLLTNTVMPHGNGNGLRHFLGQRRVPASSTVFPYDSNAGVPAGISLDTGCIFGLSCWA
jgi:hypothetical protein